MRVRRFRIFVLALVPLVAALLPVGVAVGDTESTSRVAGDTRFSTAAAIAREAFPGGSSTALVARADVFADALSASGLAGAADAPVLLSHQEEVPSTTLDALGGLDVDRILLLGGTAALSDDVRQQLEPQGYDVDRVAGANRYETATAIADRVGPLATINGETTAFLAASYTFPDALAIGPVAATVATPVLLTREDQLAPSTENWLEQAQPDQVVIVGGRLAVSTEVEDRIQQMGIETRRLAGRDRAATAAEVASFAVRETPIDDGSLLLSRGDDFPDALASAPLAAARLDPVLLTRSPDELSYDLLQWVVDHAGPLDGVVALGGTQAITERVLARTAEAAQEPADTILYDVINQAGVDAGEFRYFSEHADWSLTDQRGWSLNNDYRYTRVEQGEDFTLRLATPSQVENAASGCSAAYSCTVGDDVYINLDNWRDAPGAWSGQRLDEYRHYLVTHEVGHVIGLPHIECGDYYGANSDGEPAPVMDQQSQYGLQPSENDGACVLNTWPLPGERDRARERLASGDTQFGGGASASGSGNEPVWVD